MNRFFYFQLGEHNDVFVISPGICILESDVVLIIELMRRVLVDFRTVLMTDAEADEDKALSPADRKRRDFLLGIVDQVCRISQRALWPSGTYWLMSIWPGHERRNAMSDHFHSVRFDAWKSKFDCLVLCRGD
jgi:hypothetical protein